MPLSTGDFRVTGSRLSRRMSLPRNRGACPAKCGEERPHSREEFFERKWFWQIVVSACIEPGDPLGHRVLAVSTRMGRSSPVLRSWRHTSRPSNLGIMTSRTSASGRLLANRMKGLDAVFRQ